MLSEFLPVSNDQLADALQDNLSGSLNSFNVSYSSQFNPLTPAQPPEC